MAPRSKPSLHEQEIAESILRLNRSMDETKECLFKLAANFEAHLKQDENFYSEVKSIATGQVKIAERLGDYNTQLQIHIAGVNELKEQTKIMREGWEMIRRDIDARFKALESVNAAKAAAAQDRKESREHFANKIKIIAGTLSVGGALIGLGKLIWYALIHSV